MVATDVWVVTGASRGIGLGIVQQILADHAATVFAGARTPDSARSLQDLKKRFPLRLHLLALDVTDQASVLAAAKQVRALSTAQGVDYLMNNAGVLTGAGKTCDESPEDMRLTLATNVVGAHSMTQAFLPLLQSGQKKTVVNVSAMLGSFSYAAQAMADPAGPFAALAPRMHSYKTSKAALNMVTLSWASDVTPAEGFTFVAMHPGLVMTDMASKAMGGSGVPNPPPSKSKESAGPQVLSPEEAAQLMLPTILNLKPSDSGKLLNNDGTVLPY